MSTNCILTLLEGLWKPKCTNYFRNSCYRWYSGSVGRCVQNECKRCTYLKYFLKTFFFNIKNSYNSCKCLKLKDFRRCNNIFVWRYLVFIQVGFEIGIDTKRYWFGFIRQRIIFLLYDWRGHPLLCFFFCNKWSA